MKYSSTLPKKSQRQCFINRVILSCTLGYLGMLIINLIAWYFNGYHAVTYQLNQNYDSTIQALSQRNATITAVVLIGFNFIHQVFQNLIILIQHTVMLLLHNVVKRTHLHQIPAILLIHQMWDITSSLFKIVIVRLCNILCSLWLFIFAILLGVLDGLVARYIRTIEGGRESTLAFHKFTDICLKFPGILLLIYLLLPRFLSIDITVLLLSLIFFLTCFTATSRLKKYL